MVILCSAFGPITQGLLGPSPIRDKSIVVKYKQPCAILTGPKPIDTMNGP